MRPVGRIPRTFHPSPRRLASLAAAAVLAAVLAQPVAAQDDDARPRRSENVTVLSHIPLGAPLSVTDVEIEQDPGRPYAYVGRMQAEKGFDVIDLRDPTRAKVLYRWRIPDQELHQGLGGMDPKYFKWKNRYYVVQSLQFAQGGPNADAGAVVVDVTDLPDVDDVEVVGYVREPELPGGFHNIFVYKHSNGRVLLVTTVGDQYAHVYDMGTFVESDGEANALVARIPVPEDAENPGGRRRGYHDMYLGYHPATGQDRFYGGGTGGYYVYDVTDLQSPRLLTSVTGVPGVRSGHTFTPSPDGRYAVAETEYQYAPLRIFDLKPGLDGDVATINQPIGAWTADWENLSHNHEVRWPYVFVSGYEDGLQVFNMMDPANPTTVAWYDTYLGAHKVGMCGDRTCNGAFGVDVRNSDGLIVVSDMSTGFWVFRMEGFQGWDGRGWGMPNVSSVQDYDRGPARAAADGR